jgi:transposase-like protein
MAAGCATHRHGTERWGWQAHGGTRGRDRHAAEFKRQVPDAFEQGGPGGMQFAEQCGVKDPTFASWVKQRREGGAGPAFTAKRGFGRVLEAVIGGGA